MRTQVWRSGENQLVGGGSGAQGRKGVDRAGLWGVLLFPSSHPAAFPASPLDIDTASGVRRKGRKTKKKTKPKI